MLFRVGMWLFIAATFADAANLDDVLSDAVVIHEEQDADVRAAHAAVGTPQAQDNAATTPHRHGSRPTPAASVRVVFDQDSPSLAADPTPLEALFAVAPSEKPVTHHISRVPCELRYLRLCTLLI